jgi:hypothetical protein
MLVKKLNKSFETAFLVVKNNKYATASPLFISTAECSALLLVPVYD